MVEPLPVQKFATDNQPMHKYWIVTALLTLGLLQGCSPALNWRDVRSAGTPLLALFPCKPEEGQRDIALGAQTLHMTLLGCQAQDATFSLVYADARALGPVGEFLGQWKTVTLGNIHGQADKERPFLIKGATVLAQSVKVEAHGSRADGAPLTAHVVWFAAGDQVFQAAVYAERLDPAAASTFFEGLRFP